MPGHAINFTPYPTVNPTGAPSGDFERIEANPDAFGGAVARSEEKLGQGLEHASQRVLGPYPEAELRQYDPRSRNPFVDVGPGDRPAIEVLGFAWEGRLDGASRLQESLDDLYQQAEDKAGKPGGEGDDRIAVAPADRQFL